MGSEDCFDFLRQRIKISCGGDDFAVWVDEEIKWCVAVGAIISGDL